MSDGTLNICKDCKKAEVLERENVLKYDEEWRQKERERTREKYHRLNYKDKKVSYENRKNSNENYRKNYPEKYKAVTSSRRISCPKGFHRHHWSYNEKDWKDIIILGFKDHNDLHKFLEYDQKTFYYKTDIRIGKFERGCLLNSKEKHLEFFELIKQNLL